MAPLESERLRVENSELNIQWDWVSRDPKVSKHEWGVESDASCFVVMPF